MDASAWDRTVDVVVVGSGAAGFTAALAAADAGCRVEVLEKAELLGGTTAWSGGMPWLPLNRHEREAGVDDSREEVLRYLDGLLEDRAPDRELVEVFVDHAAEALDFLESASPLRMSILSAYPDYYADRPGARLRGRSVEPVPVECRSMLGEWYDRVRESPLMPRVTREEMTSGADLERLGAERREQGVRTMGSALISSLLKGALDRGVTVTSGCAVRRLVREGTAITGVVARMGDTEVRVGARLGVVLASGGFEWNRELVRAFLGTAEILPLSPAGNDGDGLLMGLEAGASVGNMTNAVTRPCAYDGATTLEGKPLPFMTMLRHDPGCIVVNRHGRRFANEGISYMDMGKALKTFDPATASYPDAGPVWMIFDATVRERTSVGDFVPGAPTPEWVVEAADVRELAIKTGLDPEVLGEQVERYNGFVAAGRDADFGRGTVWFEGLSSGGPSPEKNLQAIERAPFYAMRLYNGVFGTIGGLRIDQHARVLQGDGTSIEGLYAAGNVAEGVLGQTYPGGGSSLGPNITFGYLAGRHLGVLAARS